MTDEEAGAPPLSEREPPKRPWSAPTIDVLAADETEGSINSFPRTDSITGIS
jgi:hypothetical protein